jgi:hypothetical protein
MSTSDVYGGRLFTFHKDPYKRMPIFLSGNAPRCLLWIGGQGDGFFSLGYMNHLINELGSEWTIAQVMLSSNFVAHGAPDHEHDAEDLDDLFRSLITDFGMKEIALFATCTGVQIAMQVLGTGRYAETVTRVILQGTVCDPDSEFFTEAGRKRTVVEALKLCGYNRNEDTAAMRDFYDLPITPARASRGGILTVQELLWIPGMAGDKATLQRNLASIKVPTLVMMALGSHYFVAEDVQSKVEQAVQQSASTKELFLSYFNDTTDERRRMLKNAEAQHTAAVVFFLREQDEKRRQREEQARIAEAEVQRRDRSILAKASLQRVAYHQ